MGTAGLGPQAVSLLMLFPYLDRPLHTPDPSSPFAMSTPATSPHSLHSPPRSLLPVSLPTKCRPHARPSVCSRGQHAALTYESFQCLQWPEVPALQVDAHRPRAMQPAHPQTPLGATAAATLQLPPTRDPDACPHTSPAVTVSEAFICGSEISDCQ